ncbi:MAG: hypothetical protein HY923_01535 [Elusimicrobia bacterium]|nr:hypothetical protein [Elusimicrobiota bacterium]
MNKAMRCLAALAVVLGMTWAQSARAAVSDSLTVTITPNAGYSLTLSTATTGLDMGTVPLGASTQTVNPSTVTITSSFATTGLKLQGSMGGAGTPWTFAQNTAAQGSDQLAAWAVFTDTSINNYAVLGTTGTNSNYFVGTTSGTTGSNVIGSLLAPVGTFTGSSSPQFIANAGQAGRKTMASLPTFASDPNASRSFLWMYFVLPPATTDGNAKLVTLTLTAGAPNP